jgi:hypothetical protein
MTLIEALRDRDLLGRLSSFRRLETWSAWLVFLAAIYGLPLSREQEDLFCTHTGRSKYNPPAGGFQEAAAITGRQSGKTRVASVIVDHEAMQARADEDGTDLWALAIGQDLRASIRVMYSYVCAPFLSVPALKALVVGEPTKDTLRLSTGVSVGAYPCRAASVRGLRARVVVLDELAFFLSTEGNPVDLEVLRAARPTVATTSGKVVILSSPYAAAGALHALHERHYGQDDSGTLIWVASAPAMNPTLPADYLTRMETDDPEAYRSEVLGEFRTGTAALFDPDAIAACVMPGVHELA